jgi:AcrR family transcriptional regulator
MPTKGDRTRRRILDRAGPIFNDRGYQATTLSDLMTATGLEKGGLYNHFGSKDELAVAAFDRNIEVLTEMVREGVAGTQGTVERLSAVLDVYRRFAHDPPYPGGCPILNTAVRSHGTDPRLLARARQTMEDLRHGVARTLARGVERGDLRADVDVDATATVLVAAVEGALLLSELFEDPSHMDRVADHVAGHLRSLAAPPEAEA